LCDPDKLAEYSRYTRVGDVLKHYRMEKGYSFRRVEELSGVTHSYIRLLEKGMRNPTVIVLVMLADALGIPYVCLMEAAKCELTQRQELR
jgi:transcriptional regulator with XRE-family HTH domain